jgi:PadR family transcriptional regulator PadR
MEACRLRFQLTSAFTLYRLSTMGKENQPRLTAQTLKVLSSLMSPEHDEMSGAVIARTTGLATGTLYPILHRLEEANWVKSEWEAEDPHDLGRPRRRFYRITGIGMKATKLAIRDLDLPLRRLAWL